MTNTVAKQKVDFKNIYNMITQAQTKVWQQVNNTLITLYWNIGQYVNSKVENDRWGQGVVQELSKYILTRNPESKGFSDRNIWRMKKFYETYKDHEKLSAMLAEISWSNHLHILSKTKSLEEKEFYLKLAKDKPYPARDFARLIDSSAFERTMLADKKLSTALTEFPINPKGVFKDTYVFEFLNISDEHKEHDLKRALLKNLRKFLLEMGPDFSFIAEEYIVQVGMKDFRIDLLMHHRSLNCLVAAEIKVTEFQPEYLGKLQFYLEALDRDVKKPHENPSIGILICKDKDEKVVKYALNRNMSPAMIAEYETRLIDKKLLQDKLQQLLAVMESDFK